MNRLRPLRKLGAGSWPIIFKEEGMKETKRMLIVALILILTFIGTTIYILRSIMRPEKS